MKKIFKYFALAAILTATFASCNKNEAAKFDDSNAFVAFDIASTNIDEDSADTLFIPVTLASVKGLEERISYVVTDGTARADTNFVVVDSTATLSFDKDHRTAYIAIVPMADGEYTGDLNFTITLNESENVALGAASKCSVKVNDKDHPLTPILGNWTLTAINGFSGATKSFTATILKDAKDDHMVWFDNLFGLDGWKGDDMLYYGNVNDENPDEWTIVIPFGQESEYLYKGDPFVLSGVDDGGHIIRAGSATATITFGDPTTIDFGDYGFFWGIGTTTSGLAALMPGITGVKQ